MSAVSVRCCYAENRACKTAGKAAPSTSASSRIVNHACGANVRPSRAAYLTVRTAVPFACRDGTLPACGPMRERAAATHGEGLGEGTWYATLQDAIVADAGREAAMPWCGRTNVSMIHAGEADGWH